IDAVFSRGSTLYGKSSSRVRSTATRTSADTPARQVGTRHRKRFKLDGSPRKSTTEQPCAKSVMLSTDQSFPRLSEDTLSMYDKAVDLLRNNPPEQRLDIHLPYAEYLKLDECWSKIKAETKISEDQRYPYLAYDSYAEVVTVVTAPNGIHENAVLMINSGIISFIYDYLAIHSPDSVYNITAEGAETIKQFYGSYINSTKQADGLFVYRTVTGRKQTVAIEVGFSEGYSALIRNKNLWIQGGRVNACVLVIIKESPRFKNPAESYEDIEDVTREMERMGRHVDETMRRHRSLDCYDPIKYRDHTWVGKLKEVSIEVWRRGDTTTRPIPLIKNGRTCDRLPTAILRVSDLFPEEIWEAANIPESDIPFAAALIVQTLMTSMGNAALSRFFDFVSRRSE
ncbi:hypothetical protein V1525DRAFT_342311, partial [Lipomyces kononenkoae]